MTTLDEYVPATKTLLPMLVAVTPGTLVLSLIMNEGSVEWMPLIVGVLLMGCLHNLPLWHLRNYTCEFEDPPYARVMQRLLGWLGGWTTFQMFLVYLAFRASHAVGDYDRYSDAELLTSMALTALGAASTYLIFGWIIRRAYKGHGS